MSRSNRTEWAQISELVASVMAENTGKSEPEKSKYWYPLAQPSYGPKEVLGALDSMVNYKTSMWEKTRIFEKEFGERFGGEAVMVNSGSSADLLISFGMLTESGGRWKRGDEVLAPAVTWPTQIWALIMAGYSVRLVDVDPKTMNIDIDDLRKKVSSRTVGISVVHLLGNPCNMTEILAISEEFGLDIIEDACESLGSRHKGHMVGTFGVASSFSFFFSHHLMTMEGGMILCADSEFANRMRLLRAHGWDRYLPQVSSRAGSLSGKYQFESWGFNVRPTELQAAFGIEQLGQWELMESLRQSNVSHFLDGIASFNGQIDTMVVDSSDYCNWFALPLIVNPSVGIARDEVAEALEQNGVETRPIVAGNLARQPAAQKFGLSNQNLLGAEYLHQHGLYVGLHPVEDQTRIEKVIGILEKVTQR